MSAAQGFAAVPTWMIRDRSIKRSSVLVYASLASRSGLGEIYPSQDTIAEESGCSVRTVRSALSELEERGLVERRVRRSTDGRATSLTTGYTLHPNGRAATVADPSKGPEEGTGKYPHDVPLIEVENRGSAHKPKKAKAHPLPKDWSPTPEHRAKALERGVDVEVEAASFRLHAEANGREAVVWNAAFSQWLLKARPTLAPGGADGQMFAPEDAWMEFSR